MEKTFKFISAMALIAAMCLSACNKVEITEDPIDEPGIEVTPSQGWKVAISATMGGAGTKALAEDPDTHNLIATFETTDNIFVYNKTKKTMDSSPLHPDRDGASVTLTGTLAGSYEEGDELVLCYNSGSTGIFNYKDQEGMLPTVADYAKAEISITAEDVTGKTITGVAAFANMQSIFEFNFTDGADMVQVKALEVKTDGNKLVTQYGLWQNYLNPNPYQYYGGITIVADDPLSGVVYVALRNDNEGDDTFHFLVNDGAGHLHSGEKAAPAGKIVNGKFYSSTVALTPVALPSVTITASGTPVGPNAPWDPTLVNYGWSDLMFGYANYGDLTISGNSNGSWFEWLTSDHSGGDRTVTLDGATITNPLAETVPLENQDGSFTLVLSGANSITRTAASYGGGIPAISFKGNSICFQGDGTLAVTAATEEAYHCVKGIRGSDSAPNPAAASGYTLTVSDGVDNGDGTTTWVYTVRPAITATAANIAEAVAEFNASDIPDLVLSITEDIATSLTITRSNGVIDLGGHTISSDMFIQNNVEGLSIIIRNGTVSAGIDGKGGHSDYYAGTVILENLTVTSCVWNDGHAYVINGGTYNQIELNKSASTPGIITINDGFFGDIYRYVDRYGGSDDCSTFILYGGKYKYKNTTNKLDDWCPTGYSVKSNTDDDSATYPYLVSAD